ncbi:MAG: hypothetical protein IJ757_00535 [Clostridiales bacterium]|nr:hypothetical protein [Clostridiales bacterium]
MKTIQKYLKKLDRKELEENYFKMHPIELYELEDKDDLTIGEVKAHYSKRLQDYIDRLCKVELTKDLDHRSILFVREAYDADNYVGLVNEDELLEKEDLSEVTEYAYGFDKESVALAYLVADTPLTRENIMEVAVDFLWEMTWYGYEPDAGYQKAEEWEHRDDLIVSELSDIEEFGIPKEEDPIYEDLLNQFSDAYRKYESYLITHELKLIKEQLNK